MGRNSRTAQYDFSKPAVSAFVHKLTAQNWHVESYQYASNCTIRPGTTSAIEILEVVVDGDVTNGNEETDSKTIQFFVKFPYSGCLLAVWKRAFKESGVLDREQHVYKVLEELFELKHCSNIIPMPKLIYSGHQCGDVCVNENAARPSEQNSGEFLVLEKLEHFTSLKTGVKLDLPHMIMAIEGVAQLHATGHVIQQHYPSIAAKMRAKPVILNDDLRNLLRLTAIHVEILLEKAGRFSEAESIGRCSSEDQLTEELSTVYDAQSKQAVLLHSDLHSGNMMFRYETTENGHRTPKQFKMVDFQFSRLGNLVLDLFCLLTTCTDQCPEREQLRLLWSTYIDTFGKTVGNLGHSNDSDLSWLTLDYIQKQMSELKDVIAVQACVYHHLIGSIHSVPQVRIPTDTLTTLDVDQRNSRIHRISNDHETNVKMLSVFDYLRNVVKDCGYI